MKWSFFALLAMAVTLVAASTWSPIDQEIFRLKDELEASEGPDVTFYSFLGVSPKANQDDLNKAWKAKSRTMHPDKVKRSFIANKKGEKIKSGTTVSKGPTKAEINAAHQAASDRYARLGLVNKILEGEGRQRYDHFLANGFPRWRGTGYYYARFRPGLGTVLTGLFIFVGGAGHYIALFMSWKRQREFVDRYIKFARRAAWGEMGVPGLENARLPDRVETPVESETEAMQPLNRRQRRMQEKETKTTKTAKKSSKKSSPAASIPGTPTAITGPKKRVQAENGKILVVDSAGNVYLEERDSEGNVQEFLLDPEELARPTIRDTALARLPLWAWKMSAGRFLGSKEDQELEYEQEQGDEEVDAVAADYEAVAEKKQKVRSRKAGRR